LLPNKCEFTWKTVLVLFVLVCTGQLFWMESDGTVGGSVPTLFSSVTVCLALYVLKLASSDVFHDAAYCVWQQVGTISFH